MTRSSASSLSSVPWTRLAAVAALLSTFGCRKILTYDTPIPPDHPWPAAEPDATWAPRLASAQAYSAEHGGLAMLALQGDSLVYEVYANGNTDSTPLPLWSGTKTFACALAAAAQADGVLDLDASVAATLDELADGREQITARHLLQFTSGLEDARWKLSVDAWYAVEDQRVEDKYALALEMPAADPPGEVYTYASVHLHVFGALMKRTLGESPLDYLEREVLDPIGFRYAGWYHDPAGNPMFPFGAWTTGAEWLRFGALLRDDGDWEGTQVLPAGTLALCAAGSTPNPGYGHAAWLNQDVPDDLDLSHIAEFEEEGPIVYADGAADLVLAAGARGQRLYVLPSEDLVVAVLADSTSFVDAEFLARLLGDVP